MQGSLRGAVRQAATVSLVALLSVACARAVQDPMAVLANPASVGEETQGAIRKLSEGTRPISDDAKRAVRRIIFGQGYNLATRQDAFNLLVVDDPKGLREALETNIVRMDSFEFRRWILEQVGARDLKDFTTVIVNSWAGPVPVWGPPTS
jgi:hypothetical protein